MISRAKINKAKEERLNKQSLLRFDKDVKPKDLSEILYLLYNRDLRDFYYENPTKVLTYSVNTNRKFGNFNSRSKEDVYRIAKYYIPKIHYGCIDTVIDIMTKDRLVDSSFCNTCKRRVYWSRVKWNNNNRIKEIIGNFNLPV